MSSVTYRVATGAQTGRKVTTLQTLPGDVDGFTSESGKIGGFSLHAGVSANEHESAKLERLCRTITRPAVSEKRIALTASGQVRYALKTPWRDGPRMCCSIRWSSSRGWPRWCRRRART